MNHEHIEALTVDSGLPGARANLKKINDFSDMIKDEEKTTELFQILMEMWNTEANGNDPQTMLVLASLLSFSHYYHEAAYQTRVQDIFKQAMNDDRWRVREIIQESFKIIALENYQQLKDYFSTFKSPTTLEYRAMITTLAHQELLETDFQQQYSLKMLKESLDSYLVFETILDNKDDSLDAFKKSLSFAPSVFIVATPKEGFELIEQYINKSPAMNRIIKENLKKNRIYKKCKGTCDALLTKIA